MKPSVAKATQNKIIHKSDLLSELIDVGLQPGRIIPAPTKGEWWDHTKDFILHNAVIATRRRGVIWHGDLNITCEQDRLIHVARRFWENLYVVPESNVQHENSRKPSRRLIQQAVWWTTINPEDQEKFNSFKHYYDVWFPSRQAMQRKKAWPPGENWASKTLFIDENTSKIDLNDEISSSQGDVIQPTVLQHSGLYDLIWFSNGLAVLQPTFEEIKNRFGKVDFSIHPDRKTIHVRHQGQVVALIWPSPVPNPYTAQSAAMELALRQLPQIQSKLIALVDEYLRLVCFSGGPEALSKAVNRLLDAFKGDHDWSHMWAMKGVTEWKKCRAVELQGVNYVFIGTEVAIASLFQYFQRRCGIAKFLTENPTVTEDQVYDVLDHAVLTLFH